MQTSIVVNDTGLVSGIDVEWTFDDAYAKTALEDLDTNNDGFYSADELKPLTDDNLDSLKDYGFFTVPQWGTEKLKVLPPINAGQIYSNNKLTLHFTLPLEKPVDPKQQPFSVQIYDPEFFIDFAYSANEDDIDVAGTLPDKCQLHLKQPPTTAELEQTRTLLASKGKDWKPDDNVDFGSMFAPTVSIACTA